MTLFLLFLILCLAVGIFYIVALWRIFEKAGQPGWAAIVPFYNNYILFKILWGNGWLSLSLYICCILELIPIVGMLFLILFIIICVFTAHKRAVAFGQGTGFAVGLLFLPIVFDPMLAFGNYRYYGVPQDGTSYEQLRSRFGGAGAQGSGMNYQQPPTGYNGAPNAMQYKQPNNAPNNGYYSQNNGYYPPNGAQNNMGYQQPYGAQNNGGYYAQQPNNMQNNMGYAQSNNAQQPNNAQNNAGYAQQPNNAQNNAAPLRCPNCGNLSSPTARFCGKCGTRLH